MIEVQHLSKRYGRVTAVDDVSFRVERGEILGFLGPNGAGKTTTMRILTGYMPASEGKAIVAAGIPAGDYYAAMAYEFSDVATGNTERYGPEFHDLVTVP